MGARSRRFAGIAPSGKTFFPWPSTIGYTHSTSSSYASSASSVCTKSMLPMMWMFSWRSRSAATSAAASGPNCVVPGQSSAGVPREATYFGTRSNVCPIQPLGPSVWFGQYAAKMS